MALTITNISSCKDDDIYRVNVDINIANETHQLWFKSKTPLTDNIDGFVCASLFAAMKSSVDINIGDAISEKLSGNIPKIQDIFHNWYPEFQPVNVNKTENKTARNTNHGIGCFFTGGVDSFYSVLKNKDRISHLIFVYGLDIPLDNIQLRNTVSESLNNISEELEIPLIEIETNLREFTNKFGDWGEHFHGAGLVCIANLLTSVLDTIIIPSSFSYRQLFPWGTHPLIDPLWSTELIDVFHDGCKVERIKKVEFISHNKTALKSLRVCYVNLDSAYNCCQCEKCLRTMASLRAVGALKNCSSFDRELNLDSLSKISLNSIPSKYFLDENIEYVTRKGTDKDLLSSLNKCLIDNNTKSSLRNVLNNIDVYSRSKDWPAQRNALLRKLWDTDKAWMLKENMKEILKSIFKK